MKKNGIVPEETLHGTDSARAFTEDAVSDLTVVGASHAIELALTAANKVAAESIEADVIDLRTIKPLDIEIIGESVKHTGRLLVVDTGWSMGGVCAEIGCLAAEHGWSI